MGRILDEGETKFKWWFLLEMHCSYFILNSTNLQNDVLLTVGHQPLLQANPTGPRGRKVSQERKARDSSELHGAEAA